MPYYDDPLVHFDDLLIFYDDPGLGYGPVSPPLNQPLPSLGTTAMEYWEITEDRAIKTLPVWLTHVPTLKVNGLGPDEYEDLFDQFEPKAQERTLAFSIVPD